MKVAGLRPDAESSNAASSQGAMAGMAAGASLGGRLGEALARRTRKELFGMPIPFTQKMESGTASNIGSTLGALLGGGLGHLGASRKNNLLDSPGDSARGYTR